MGRGAGGIDRNGPWLGEEEGGEEEGEEEEEEEEEEEGGVEEGREGSSRSE